MSGVALEAYWEHLGFSTYLKLCRAKELMVGHLDGFGFELFGCGPVQVILGELKWVWLKINTGGYAGCGPYVHLPGRHSQVAPEEFVFEQHVARIGPLRRVEEVQSGSESCNPAHPTGPHGPTRSRPSSRSLLVLRLERCPGGAERHWAPRAPGSAGLCLDPRSSEDREWARGRLLLIWASQPFWGTFPTMGGLLLVLLFKSIAQEGYPQENTPLGGVLKRSEEHGMAIGWKTAKRICLRRGTLTHGHSGIWINSHKS